MVRKLKYLTLLLLACMPVLQLQAVDARPYAPALLGDVCIIVVKIEFDHSTSNTTDALNLRENKADDLEHTGNGAGEGEWLYASRNEPALYKCGQTVSCLVTFQAYDTVTGKPFTTDVPLDVKATGLNEMKGNLKKTAVTIPANSTMKRYVKFDFDKTTEKWDGTDDNEIQKIVGRLKWECANAGQTDWRNFSISKTGPHTFYTILPGGLKTPWSETPQTTTAPHTHEPWVSALEFSIVDAGLEGKKTDLTVASTMTTYLHTSHGIPYDTVSGADSYTAFVVALQRKFNATAYMAKTGVGKVNCSDQAHAVKCFSAIVGTSMTMEYCDPFGYINTTVLCGIVGNCNNPFYTKPPVTAPVVVGFPRSSFSFHQMCTMGGNLYDATCGPEVGTDAHAAYIVKMIDVATPAAQKAKVTDFEDYNSNYHSIY
ncbi:MAG: hypothetical protein V3V74_07045 [Nitrosomonadaceae bacterium]